MCGLIGGYIDNYSDNYECKIRKALDLLHNRGPNARDYKLHKLSMILVSVLSPNLKRTSL